jgi:PAS domain S-box-containing protein
MCPMVKKSLNKTTATILVVEDDESLCHLIKRRLDRADFNSEVAFSGAEAIRRAVATPPALVLLDYKLPDMPAEEVITALNEHNIAFVIATGQGDEKTAVAMMKLGARDYVVKDYNFLDRLPQVVKQTLDKLETESKLRVAEEDLRVSEERYRSLYESAPEGIVVVDATGYITSSNAAFSNITGFSPDEIVGIHFAQLPMIKGIEGFDFAQVFSAIVAGQISGGFEFPWRHKNGDIRIGHCTPGILGNGEGITGLQLILSDITERKQAEEALIESEQKFRGLYESMDMGTALCEVVTDKNGNVIDYIFLDIDEKYTLITGITREIAIGKTAHEVDPNIEQCWIDVMGEVATTGKSDYYENYYASNDKYYALYAYCPAKNRFACLVQDITERKRAEESLRESEKKFKTAVLHSGIIFAHTDCNLRYTWITNPHPDFNPETMIGKQDIELSDNQGSRKLMEMKQEVIETASKKRRDISFPLSNGNHVFDIIAEPLRDGNGQVIGVSTCALAITERKRAEEQIKETQILLKSSIESPKDMIILSLDRQYRYLYFNKIHEESMNQVYNLRPKIGDIIFDYMTNKEDVATVKAHYDRALGGEGHTTIDEYGVAERNYYEVRYNPIYNDDNEIIGVTSFASDITDRKRAEEQIRKSEKDLAEARRLAGIGSWEWFPESGHINLNDQWINILGYVVGEREFDFKWWQESIDPDSEPVFEKALSDYLEGRKSKYELEYRMKTKEGNWKWIWAVGECVEWDKAKKPVRFLGTHIDITDRKRAEEQIRKLGSAVDQSIDGIAMNDSTRKIVYANQTYASMHGYTMQEIMELRFKDLIPGDGGQTWPVIRESVRGKDAWSGEIDHIRKDGTTFPAYLSITNLRDETGKQIGVLSICRDITESKRAEEKLRLSAAQWQDTFDAMNDPVCLLNVRHEILRYNKAMVEFVGKPADEITGTLCWELIHGTKEPVKDCPLERMKQSLKKETMVLEAGDSIYEVTVHPEFDADGVLIGSVHIIADITERKQAEEALKQRLELESLVAEISNELANIPTDRIDNGINFALEKIARFTGANRSSLFTFSDDLQFGTNTHEWCSNPDDSQIDQLQNFLFDMFGYHKKQLINLESIVISGINDYPAEAVSEKEWIREHGFRSMLFVPINRRGKLHSTVGIYGETGKEIVWTEDFVTFLNIIGNTLTTCLERKYADESLRASEEKYANLVERGNDGIIIIQGNSLKFVNSKMAKMTGYTPEELAGKPFIEFVATGDKKTVMDRYTKRMSGEKVPSEYEIAIVRKDGTEMSVEINASLTKYEGAPADMAIIRDVTERKKYEQALVSSEAKTRAILSAIPDMIFVMKKDGTIIDYIPSSVMKSSIPVNKFLGKKIKDVLPPEMAAGLMRLLAKAFKSGKLQSDEGSMELPDGEHFYDNRIIVLDKDTALGIAQDITERKRVDRELKESEENVRLMVSEVKDYAIIMLDPNGVITSWNEGAERIKGYSADEIIGKHSSIFYSKEDIKTGRSDTLLKEAVRIGRAEDEGWRIRKDGSQFVANVIITAIRDEKGKLKGYSKVTRDITNRKQAEESLKKLGKFNEMILDSAGEGIYGLDLNGTTTFANPAAASMIGWELDDLTGKSQHDILHHSHADGTHYKRKECPIYAAFKDGKVHHVADEVFWRKDGSSFPVEYISTPIRNEQDVLTGAVVTFKDITKRKQAEEQIKKYSEHLVDMVEERTAQLSDSEERYRTLFNNTADVVYMYDRSNQGNMGKILDVNSVAINLYGYSKEELLERTPFEFADPELKRDYSKQRREFDEIGNTIFESMHITKDGRKIAVEVSANALVYKGLAAGISVVRDITRRKEMEAALQESEERYRTLFDNTNDAVYVMERDTATNKGYLTNVNQVFMDRYGYTKNEFTKMSPLSLVAPEAQAQFIGQIRDELFEKGAISYETVHISKGGKRMPVEINARRFSYKDSRISISVARDISERKAIEKERIEIVEKLAKTEKLALVGQLASGIAHELRNPLAIINNAAYYINAKVKDDDDKVKKSLAFIQQEVFRSSHIIEGLLDLARTKQPNYEICDIRDTIDIVLEHITLPENVTVSVKCPKGIPKLQFDCMQIERVFNNIIINAIQSMPDGGDVTIDGKMAGKSLVVIISDTGGGIAVGDIDKIFEPMFTTKESMGGIGIGLAVSKSIIDAHSGTMTVESTIGKGTTFTVKLPSKASM